MAEAELTYHKFVNKEMAEKRAGRAWKGKGGSRQQYASLYRSAPACFDPCSCLLQKKGVYR